MDEVWAEKIKAYRDSIKEEKPDLDIELLLRILDIVNESSEMHSGIAAIPLEADERMQVGYIMHNERRPGSLLLRYIDELHQVIAENPTVEASYAKN